MVCDANESFPTEEECKFKSYLLHQLSGTRDSVQLEAIILLAIMFPRYFGLRISYLSQDRNLVKLNRANLLPLSVAAAQVTLTHLGEVRILQGQPIYSRVAEW